MMVNDEDEVTKNARRDDKKKGLRLPLYVNSIVGSHVGNTPKDLLK